MKLSVKKLKKWKASSPGIDLYIKAGCPNTVEKTVEMYIESENELYLSHANWLLNKAFSKKQNIQYAIYAAESVIGIFEKRYPEDKRPRLAIKAAKAYLKNPRRKTRDAAYAADDAADAAADAVVAAAYAAYAAAYAADAAAYAANAITYATCAAAGAAARAAARAAADVVSGNRILIKILKYGVGLLAG